MKGREIMSKNPHYVTPEWSVMVPAEDVPPEGLVKEIEADQEVCAALARRFRVEALSDVRAHVTLYREYESHIVFVRGEVSGIASQPCAVTGDMLTEEVRDGFEAWFSDQDGIASLALERRKRQGKRMDAEMPIADEDEEPEPMIDSQVDIGELAAQYLALAITPFPRKEDAERDPLVQADARPAPEEKQANPFAVLKKLQKGEE